MKLKLNKFFMILMSLFLVLFGIIFVSARNIENVLSELSIDEQQAKTAGPPATLSIYSGSTRLDYISDSKGNAFFFPMKKVNTSGMYSEVYAYCLDHKKTTPNRGNGSSYKYSAKGGNGYLYAMEVDTGLNGNYDYYTRSLAIHILRGDGEWTINTGRDTSGVDVKTKIKSIVDKINSGTAKTSRDVTISLNEKSLSFTNSGSNYDSQWVDIVINKNSELKYGPKLVSATVKLSGAPAGTQIIKSDGSIATNGNLGTATKFKVRVPASAISGTIQVSVSVTAVFEVGVASFYTPVTSGLQGMCIRTTENITVSSGSTGSGTIVGGGNLEVIKKGSDGKFLANASFQLRSGNTSITEVQTTDVNGKTVFTNIPAGTYTLVETSAPEGYENAGSCQVTITSGNTATKTVVNQRSTGSYKVIKKDDSGNLLQGAKFQLQQGSTIIAGPYTTNDKGEVLFTNIPTGNYSLVEVQAPTGYKIDPNQNGGTIEVESSRVAEAVITNKLIRGNIKVSKIDSVDSNIKISGAEFKLYNSSNTLVSTAVTDASGVATFKNIPYGNYTVRESKAPEGYFLNSKSNAVNITTDGATYNCDVYNDRRRDHSMPGYNIKDSNGEFVGTLEKNKSYDLNVRIESEYENLTLPSGAALGETTIDKLKYAIAVNDGTINQDVSTITTSNIKGTVISSGTRTNIKIKDMSSIWQKINFKVPNDDSHAEVVIVVEIQSSKDGNDSNNRLVIKLPIVNEKDDKVFINNIEVYPSAAGDALVGNDVNVKLDVGTDSLKTYDVDSTITINGPIGFGTKRVSKSTYGVSMENSGSTYFKFKPTVAGSYTISATAKIPGSTATSSTKTITVVQPSEPKKYLTEPTRTESIYSSSSYITTYIKMKKRDKDKVEVSTCSEPCQEDEKGGEFCPGHKAWVWNDWYDAFIPRKLTQMSNIKENFEIVDIEFRSKVTEDNANKYSQYIGIDGYIDMLNSDSAKYAQVKAGYGFELKVKTEYSNNLPEVFNKAYSSNSAPENTTWSQYKVMSYSGSKMPFIYSDIYGDKDQISVDEQVSSYSGIVSVAVPALSDLIIESPNQLYIKMPDPSNEYFMVNEGYGASYSNNKIMQRLVMTNTTGVKLTNSKYSEVKDFEFMKDSSDLEDKRGYYVSKEVTDGVRTLSIYNRYAGYGLNKNTRLHDKKDINIKVSGGRYDDLKDSE